MRVAQSCAKAHKAIGARHYYVLTSLFLQRIYVLEINTLPGITDKSLLPKH